MTDTFTAARVVAAQRAEARRRLAGMLAVLVGSSGNAVVSSGERDGAKRFVLTGTKRARRDEDAVLWGWLNLYNIDVESLDDVVKIQLQDKSIDALPKGFGELSKLTELDLTGNNLASLPGEIGKLSALRVLRLTENKLVSLPVEIGRLSALIVLVLRGNKLESLPVAIGNLSALKSLYLRGNKLVSLPGEIGNLSALVDLELSKNELASLPVAIGNLSALKRLDLGGNKLVSLPDEIGKLGALESLDLEENELSFVPLNEQLTVYAANNRLLATFRSQASLLPMTINGLNENQRETIEDEARRANKEPRGSQQPVDAADDVGDQDEDVVVGAAVWRKYLTGQPLAFAIDYYRYTDDPLTTRWILDALTPTQRALVLSSPRLPLNQFVLQRRAIDAKRFECNSERDIVTLQQIDPGDLVMFLGFPGNDKGMCLSRRSLFIDLAGLLNYTPARRDNGYYGEDATPDNQFVRIGYPPFYVLKKCFTYIKNAPLQIVYRARVVLRGQNLVSRDTPGLVAKAGPVDTYALVPQLLLE